MTGSSLTADLSTTLGVICPLWKDSAKDLRPDIKFIGEFTFGLCTDAAAAKLFKSLSALMAFFFSFFGGLSCKKLHRVHFFFFSPFFPIKYAFFILLFLLYFTLYFYSSRFQHCERSFLILMKCFHFLLLQGRKVLLLLMETSLESHACKALTDWLNCLLCFHTVWILKGPVFCKIHFASVFRQQYASPSCQ